MKISEDGVLTKIELDDVKDGKLAIPEGVRKIEFEKTEPIDNEPWDYRMSAPIGGVINNAVAIALKNEITEISFPATLREIAPHSFEGFSKLKKVVLPDKLEILGAHAFQDCGNLEKICLSRSLRTIEEGTFDGCHKLEYIIIPDSVRKIEKNAFRDCESIERIRLSNNLEEVEAPIFNFLHIPTGSKRENEIKDIQELVMPERRHRARDVFHSVRYGREKDSILTIVMPIGEGTGHVLAKDSAIYRDSKTYLEEMHYGSGKDKTKPAMFMVKADVKDKVFEMQDTVEYRSVDAFQIPKGILVVGEFACSEWEKLESVIIPEGVVAISRGAFAHCSNLQEVFLPKSLKYIDAGAFMDCPALEKVELPKHVEIIGENAFKDCTGLENVQILGKEVQIQRGTFENCEKMENIPDLSRVVTIGAFAFKGAGKEASKEMKQENKKALLIPKNVGGIGVSCFEECNLFSSVVFDTRSKIETIPDGAFRNCASMEKISIPQSVTEIGAQAFENCTSLFGTVELPDGIEKIGSKAFKGCTTLKGKPHIKGRADVAADAFDVGLIELPDDSAKYVTGKNGRLYVTPEQKKAGFSLSGLVESVKKHKDERAKRREQKAYEEQDWR